MIDTTEDEETAFRAEITAAAKFNREAIEKLIKHHIREPFASAEDLLIKAGTIATAAGVSSDLIILCWAMAIVETADREAHTYEQ